MATVKALAPNQLYQQTDPDQFGFDTTDELEDMSEIIGQPRAVDAVRFGLGINKKGYNIFALGPAGAGKRSLVMKFFEQRAEQEPVPDDWIYVHNFNQDYKPNAIRLPAGKGLTFQRDMEQLVEDLQSALNSAFESDEYRTRRQVIEEELQARQEKAFESLQEEAKTHDLALIRTPSGLVFAPVKNGEVMPPEDFKKLPQAVREQMETSVSNLQEELQKILQVVPIWQREARLQVKELNQEMTDFAAHGLLDELRRKYSELAEIPEFLSEIQKDIVEHASEFLPGEESSGDEVRQTAATAISRSRQVLSPLHRYKVNLLVDHHNLNGAPVIFEDNPTYQNLIGRVEHLAQMGALVTDFTLIKPGSLHLANGGFLILDARKVLQQPFAWDALKRSLLSHQIRLEAPGQMLGLITTVSLEPEPIDLDIKVALIGDRLLYYLLSEIDPEFNELFKVQADFDEEMPRTPDNQQLYARLIATLARKDQLKALDRGAVARIIEQSARLVGDSQRLSIQFNKIIDLLRESDYWASQGGSQTITIDHVQKAIDAQVYRADRVRERYQESIFRDTILIDTQGSKIGQVNGLSVLQLGDFSFGVPSRITARVRRGKGDVINIEREVDLSGPIHSKGVLILAGFLAARYSSEKPLSLSASLVFEQSYAGVEGDSASSAELYALLSALAETPINQSLAVTGSVNQHGEVQAIGGVNEKIEGFFDICKARGLTGDQGVLIPVSNVKNLMLRRDVVESVKDGNFQIYPVVDIDQGIELLTGIPAGISEEDGNYTENTINGRVQARLARLIEKEKNEKEDTSSGEKNREG
jgi:lon-related putative ATP-dependent protease